MSDVGGQENGKEYDNQSARKSSGKEEEFVRAISKIAVAQICENEGFQSFQHSALEALADVGVRYMKEIGRISNRFANQQGRSECNVFDVIQGLEDLNSIQGFPGASDVHHSVANSGTIREISQYVSLVEGVEFVFSLPRFPVSRERFPPSSFLQKGKDPPHHIPPWLPAFPCDGEADAHTANNKQQHDKEVEVVPNEGEVEVVPNEGEVEVVPNEGEVEVVPNKGEVELTNTQEQQQQQQQQQLQQQLQQQHVHLVANNGSEAVAVNPFLAPPFAYGEKAVSLVEPPSRIWEGNHVNVMDTYATPIPETAHNEVLEVEETNKHIKLDGRPTVRLKFGSARKSLRTCKNVVAQTNGVEKLAILFERDDESDEMKRKAEQILKDSMEIPLDTTEL